METITGNLYDFPKYYDLVFGSDWKAERDFLLECFARHASRPIRQLFEPACGTGRLLVKFAKAGFQVGGNDLNPHAVDYCNARLARQGLARAAVVGDMADFRLAQPVDAAFNMINSFRHLATERAAEAHLRCVARALARGGLYLLGLHLTPTAGRPLAEESWSARRGHLSVISRLWTEQLDLRRRRETVGMSFDIFTPRRTFRVVDQVVFRTYTQRQLAALIRRVPALQVLETYDFAYRADCPIRVGPRTEDVVYVLLKK